MAICNPDGTPYKPKGNIGQFDPTNPSIDLFNDWDAEAIRLGGSPVLYYECFIQMNTVDKLYNEDRGKLFSPVGLQLFAWYEPLPSQNAQSEFGIDALEEIEFQLNYRDVLRRIGHPPKVGSRLFTPHRNQHWQIIQRNVDDFKLWSQIRLKLYCAPFQESSTTGEGRETRSPVDFEIR